MEVKKCVRCGCFFVAENDVCLNCNSKDKLEINKLNNYIENNFSITDVQELSLNTDVSINNINRFIKNDALKNLNIF